MLLSKPENLYYSDSLFNSGNYKTALLEYERLVFLGEDNIYLKNEILLKKSDCYKQIKDYNNALTTIKRINIFVCNDSLKEEIFTKSAIINLLKEDYSQAKFDLLKIGKLSLNEESYFQTNILLIISENYLNNWTKASKLFDKLVTPRSNLDSNIVNKVQELYKNIPDLKSKDEVYLLSFIPGMGIFYAGNKIEGIFNFSLNALPLAFGVSQILNGFYFTGYFGSTIILQKFYFGGRNRAKYLVNKYNFYTSEDYNLKLKKLLLSFV